MSCYECKHFSELKKPRLQKDKDGFEYTIYGYCFSGQYQPRYNKGNAVFIQNGTCKQFKRERKRIHGEADMQTLPA